MTFDIVAYEPREVETFSSLIPIFPLLMLKCLNEPPVSSVVQRSPVDMDWAESIISHS